MRWTVLRQAAISLLVAALALPAGARTRPHYGGTLRVEVEGDPWQRPDGMARRLVMDGLTTLGADSAVQPALAIRWASENNDHRWQFWLRPGVRFQNDSALTAAAIEASLTASCGASCPWSAVHAVGSSVVFTADSPMPNLPALLAGLADLVDGHFDKVGAAHAQVEPLVTNGARADDLNRIGERPAAPAVLVGDQVQGAMIIRFAGEFKWARAHEAQRRAGNEPDKVSVAGEQRREVGHG